MMFIKIQASEDGDPVTVFEDREDLMEWIDGATEGVDPRYLPVFRDKEFLFAHPDPNYGWSEHDVVIMEANVVIPQAVTAVTKWHV
jgi:hypothetical protein